MMSKKFLFILISLLAVLLLVTACGTNTLSTEAGNAAQTPAPSTDTEEAEHGDEMPSDEAAHQEGDGHAVDEQAAEAPHTEGDSHAPDAHMAEMGMHSEGDEHNEGDGHAEGDEHGVPAEAMAVENPVPATEDSIAAGAATYTQYCAVCHGNEGKGDGPGAAALNPKPADFSAEHVQVLSDGGLFWFVTNGVPNSAMPPWGEVLSEQQRWEVVNFLRTFKNQ